MSIPIAKKQSPRIAKIVEQIKPDIPTWDLCCDHGIIGMAVLTAHKSKFVYFIDQQPHIIQQLNQKLNENGFDQNKFEVRCADILKLVLPDSRCNFVIAGVGTNLIMKFLSKFDNGLEHRVICHTDQNAERFESILKKEGFNSTHKESVLERGVIHHLWVIDFFPDCSR